MFYKYVSIDYSLTEQNKTPKVLDYLRGQIVYSCLYYNILSANYLVVCALCIIFANENKNTMFYKNGFNGRKNQQELSSLD